MVVLLNIAFFISVSQQPGLDLCKILSTTWHRTLAEHVKICKIQSTLAAWHRSRARLVELFMVVRRSCAMQGSILVRSWFCDGRVQRDLTHIVVDQMESLIKYRRFFTVLGGSRGSCSWNFFQPPGRQYSMPLSKLRWSRHGVRDREWPLRRWALGRTAVLL